MCLTALAILAMSGVVVSLQVETVQVGAEGAVSPDGAATATQQRACEESRLLDPRATPWEGTPPELMPPHLEWAYTRCGAVPVARFFVDDSNGGKGTSIEYGREDVLAYIRHWEPYLDADPKGLRRLGKDRWLVQALQTYPIKNKRVVVFGSIDPRIESLCLAFGAAHVTTVEYNEIVLVHDDIRITTPDVFDAQGLQFEVALSLSSFDHDGLGRYGDPLCPDGDLLAMDMVRRHLAPGGMLFLTVPVGADSVVWNLHRRYGPIRLPLLLQGYDVVERFGWRESLLSHKGRINQSYEPVFVLTPAPTAAAASEAAEAGSANEGAASADGAQGLTKEEQEALAALIASVSGTLSSTVPQPGADSDA